MNTNDREAARELLIKYRTGTCTEQELMQLESWYNVFEIDGLADLSDKQLAAIAASRVPVVNLRRSTILVRYAVAAMLLMGVAIGSYFYAGLKSSGTGPIVYADDVSPGSNKAALTLSDGRKIDLAHVGNGEVAKQAGVRILKQADGHLVYSFSSSEAAPSLYNTVSTPLGGQHEVSLPDGSRVWLNSASSLRFPIRFAANGERRVELTGEGYFEVAKDKAHPFVVRSANQEVRVLGTRFNINGYSKGGKINTVLLEGSVELSGNNDSVLLKPGEEGSLTAGGFRVKAANVERAVAWKNGYFMFVDQNLEEIMRSISRWYDVEIDYKDEEVKKFNFWGTAKRFGKVSDLLRVLERTGKVHFEITGNKIIVSR